MDPQAPRAQESFDLQALTQRLEWLQRENALLGEQVTVLAVELERLSEQLPILYSDLEAYSASNVRLMRRVFVLRPLGFLREIGKILRGRAPAGDTERRTSPRT